MPRHEGDGWGSSSTNLPADSYSNPPHWSFHEAVLQSDKCFCGVVVVERIYANVSYCSFVAPGNNSLEVYERVE